MISSNAHPDAAFIAQQKTRLLTLRAEIQETLSGATNDEIGERLANGEAADREDDGQKLDALERDGLLEKHAAARLESIDRALQKIENGSYGISTVSGKPIPRARLEAVPEALWDTQEDPNADR